MTEWQSSELADGQAPKSVINTRQVLRQALASAVDLGLLATNVVDKVKAPKRPTSTARALTADEARALIAAAASDRLGAAVALLFVQAAGQRGARPGVGRHRHRCRHRHR